MAELSEATRKLVEQYQTSHNNAQKKDYISPIHVDEVAAKVAAFYGKLRGIIDWQEEHLMKRATIVRNLRRRLILASSGKNVAEPLVLELIRAGHFPNDQIEESKILVIEKILDKYIYLNKNASEPTKKRKLQLYNWLLSIAACEIEETLSPPYQAKALIGFMVNSVTPRIKVKENRYFNLKNTEEKDTQVFIAVQRALFKLDNPIITYNLIRRRYPQWAELDPTQLAEIGENIYSVWESLERDLNHPLKNKFYNFCEKYDTPYLLLGDILSKDSSNLLKEVATPEALEQGVREAYQKRLSTLKKRLFRAAAYSTLSIFLTNIFSFLIVEIPLAKLITDSFSPLTIVVDIMGPTFLMFLLMTTVKLPSKSNLEVVILETMKIVYQKDLNEKDIYTIKVTKKRNIFVKALISLLYLAGATLSVGIIITIFKLAGFPITSMVINSVFIALIAFAGLTIRNRAEELTVEDKKQGFFAFLFDMIFLPLVEIGRWFSEKWKKYNALAIIFSALVDMPFSVFVEFLEQWRYFLKERKEGIH